MPDAQGNLRGQGWSRKREEGWQRVFGTERCTHRPLIFCSICGRVPTEAEAGP
jgi:hypothetical protein